jgi:hypothetical protein
MCIEYLRVCISVCTHVGESVGRVWMERMSVSEWCVFSFVHLSLSLNVNPPNAYEHAFIEVVCLGPIHSDALLFPMDRSLSSFSFICSVSVFISVLVSVFVSVSVSVSVSVLVSVCLCLAISHHGPIQLRCCSIHGSD